MFQFDSVVGATLAVARIPAARPPEWMCTGRVQDPPLRYILIDAMDFLKWTQLHYVIGFIMLSMKSRSSGVREYLS